MKVLILTVSAGYGHTSTAKSIEDSLNKKGVATKVVDVYRYINKLLSQTIDKSTVLYAKYTPEAYRLIYQYLDNGNLDERFNLMGLINSLGSFKFEKLLKQFEPDAIICTHVFAAQLVNELKRRGKTAAKLIGICTDYTIHPYWETVTNMDYFCIAAEELKYRAVRKGVPGEIIRCFGIPVHPKFSQSVPKAQARTMLGYKQSSKIVLLMGGGLGYGMFEGEADKILRGYNNLELVVVCGNSRRQYNEFARFKQRYAIEDMHVYGFVDNINLIMDAADILVSKPGGLTVTEALVKRIPMVAVNPIAGQEERNIEFLLNMGVCVFANKTFPLDEAVKLVMNSEQRMENIRQNIEILRKPNAAQDTADFVIDVINGGIELLKN